MAEPKVSILLTLVDKLSGPAESARGAVTRMGASFKAMGAEAMALLNNKLVQGIGLAGMGVGLNKAFAAADAFRIALQKLEGTAKITGVPLEFLQKIAADAEVQFGLSKTQASDFAVEMAKLASKAGDVGKAAPALEAFLEIGAARGMTAQETLKAVQQSILGIDEGTDKLFNANPSVLYAQFAESIGTTAGKLTDAQKAQALLTIAMEDGAKVTGTYNDFLQSTAGQLQLMRNKTEEAYATLGQSLDDLRNSTASAVGWIAEGAQQFIGGVQLIANDIGYLFARIPTEIKLMWASLVVGVAEGVNALGSVIPFVGDKLQEVAARMGASGRQVAAESAEWLNALKTAHGEVSAEIVGVEIAGQKKQTAAVATGGADRTKETTEAAKAREKVASESAKAMEVLEKAAFQSQMALLTAQEREYQEMVALFRREMEKMTDAHYRRAEEMLKQEHLKMLMKWSGLNDALIPMIREPITQLKPVITEFGERVAAAAPDRAQHEKWGILKEKIAETGAAIGQGAEEILRFGRDIGSVNPQMEALVGGIGRLAEGIGGIASGNLMQGLASGILGLQGIVGSLFGNSPAEQARKALLQRNTQALQELERSNGLLLRAQSTGAQVEAAKGALGGLETLSGMGGSGVVSKARLNAFRGLLQSVGLTMTDAERIAKDIGIDLGISGDGMSQAGVQAFVEGLKKAQFGSFEQSFSGQLDKIQFDSDIAGGFTPEQELARIGQLLGSDFGSSALAQAFAGIDLSTAEGRATLLQRLMAIGGNIESMPDGARGGLTGRDFTSILTRATSLLRQDGGLALAPGATDFSLGAPTVSSPITMSTQASANLFGPISETAANTRRTADGVDRLVGLVDSGALSPTIVQGGVGTSLDALNIALQAERDLAGAAGVA